MSKTKMSNISALFLLISITYVNGLKTTFSLLYQTLKYMNSFFVQLYNTSILTYMFKYIIAYPTVGLILVLIGSPRGKEGHITGKALYFIVGYIIGIALNFLAGIIF